MLVLSRKKNQGIHIGGNIHINVAQIQGDKVRLAITCDRDIPVHRDEVMAIILKDGIEKIPNLVLERKP